MKNIIAGIGYYFLQWTVGLPQNVIGLTFWVFTRSSEKYRYRKAAVKSWRFGGSMGLGMFIFMGDVPMHEKEYVLRHEYGHTIQSVILGPLFLPVIGLPSLLWASIPAFQKLRTRKKISYYSLYTEKWANALGGNGKTQGARRQARPSASRRSAKDVKNDVKDVEKSF